MTGRIIPFHGDLHDDTTALLPWYITDRLDADDRIRVEAHLATCPQCQQALSAEQRLHEAIRTLPADTDGLASVDTAWAALTPRLKPRASRRLRPAFNRIGRQWRASAPWLRWAVAAQLLLLVTAGGLLLQQITRPAAAPAYHTLSSSTPPPVTGNIVVIFRPDIRESDLRQTLRDSHARLVDGPTAADAYLLQVPAAARDRTLADLRARPTIVLAQPIDAPKMSAP